MPRVDLTPGESVASVTAQCAALRDIVQEAIRRDSVSIELVALTDETLARAHAVSQIQRIREKQ